MSDVLYVGLQEDDKIASFSIDAGSGKLALTGETAAAGAPSAFALSPDRRVLYVGYRGTPAIESCRIDSSTGALTSLGRISTEHAPTYLATDRTGKYLLSAYYQGGYAAVHPLGSDGAVSGPALDRQNTAPGAHAILTTRRTAWPSCRISPGRTTTSWSRRRTSPGPISSRSSGSIRPAVG